MHCLFKKDKKPLEKEYTFVPQKYIKYIVNISAQTFRVQLKDTWKLIVPGVTFKSRILHIDVNYVNRAYVLVIVFLHSWGCDWLFLIAGIDQMQYLGAFLRLLLRYSLLRGRTHVNRQNHFQLYVCLCVCLCALGMAKITNILDRPPSLINRLKPVNWSD